MSRSLKGPLRAVLSHEQGYYKKVWGEALTICLAYPNTYRTGMSNLGFQTVYNLINRNDNALCERVFLPEPNCGKPGGSTPLVSLESQRPLTDFDIVAFSLPFENDYPNILNILALGRIALLSSQRKEREPLVLGGGIAVTLNPEPLANFIDCFILGEGEEVTAEFITSVADGMRNGMGREEILFRLQRDIAGVYVPRLYQVSYGENHQIEKRTAKDTTLPETIRTRSMPDINAFLTEQCITSAASELGSMFLIEVSRGCNRGCRFCAAGYIYRPARFRDAEVLKPAFLRGIERSARIGLLGTAVSDHPDLPALFHLIRGQGGEVAIGSLRLDRLDHALVALLKEGGAETLSLAPEAGSQRLRDVIRKGIREEQIHQAVEMLVEQGIPNLRLYVMVGLPTEEEEDIDAIIAMIKKIKHTADHCSRGTGSFRRITLSINQFIPKAATPFQWCPLTDISIVKKRTARIVHAFRRDPAVRVIHDLPKWNYVQALLSLGDRRIGDILLAVHTGAGNWPKALKEVNVNADFFVYRHKDPAEILPGDFIDHGVSKAFLQKEYALAFAAEKAGNTGE